MSYAFVRRETISDFFTGLSGGFIPFAQLSDGYVLFPEELPQIAHEIGVGRYAELFRLDPEIAVVCRTEPYPERYLARMTAAYLFDRTQVLALHPRRGEGYGHSPHTAVA